jgi:hypothetical protein
MTKWFWYAGQNEEWFTVGPCDCKEQAIDEAVDSNIGEFQDEDGKWFLGIHVLEAAKDDVLLSKYFDVESAIENANERLGEDDYSEYVDPSFFDMTPQQEQDLVERIKQTIDNWQQEHNLVFKTNMFTKTRNEEYIVIPVDEGN